MSDSEVSPKADLGKTSGKPSQVDCVKEVDKAGETLDEDIKEEGEDSSTGGDGADEVMYDIDIDSDNEKTGRRDRDIQKEGEASSHEEACSDNGAACMSGSVDDEGHGIKQQAEAPEEREESHTEPKVMLPLVADGHTLLCFNLWVLWLWWRLHSCNENFVLSDKNQHHVKLMAWFFLSLLILDFSRICYLYSLVLYGKL